jgi:hypothetical protein
MLQEYEPEKMFIVGDLIIKGYCNITEMINKKKYPISIPSNIETPQLYHWSDDTYSTQLYEPIFTSLVPSARTINELIDFCSNKIDFQIHIDNEGRNPIFEIEWAVRTYLSESQILEQAIQYRSDERSQYVKNYIRKTKLAYGYFNKMLMKTLNKAKLEDQRIHSIDRLIMKLRGIDI